MGPDRFHCSTAASTFTEVASRPLHSRLAVPPLPHSRTASMAVITDCDFEKDNAYEEVLKRIGRNLLLFQKAEQLMKCLLTMGNADPSEGFEQHGAIWQKPALEQLKDQLAHPLHPGAAQRGESIDLLVREQNHFVHDLLPALMPDTLANFRSLSAELDGQRERILPEIQRLLEDTTSLQSHLLELLTFPQSSEEMKQLAPSGER
ncbi:MAG: hypothetical protein V4819_04545 [Verrucomicrobiota bacterium]